MQDKKLQNQKEDGLPKIAETMKSKKIIAMVLAAMVAIVIVGSFLLSRSAEKPESVKEESYSVESESVLNTKMPQAPVNASPGVSSKQEDQVNQETSQAQMAFLVAKQKELEQRLSAPLMVVSSNGAEKNSEAIKEKSGVVKNPNMQFMEEASDRGVKPEIAASIGSLSTVIAEGSFIHAILEPATNSDLPGFLRAIVSEPSYSEDGSTILIPRGSRLTGEYKSGMLKGQSRIFIAWTRLITPAGVSVQLGSAGVDSLGVAGMGADSINRHFWERFGMASLLSLIGAGAANAGVSGSDQNNSASSYRTALASSFSQSASESLQQDGMIAPTLKTHQGKPIMVFVARDLQFGGALKETTPSINVF